jgi:hypothetical protein
MPLPSDEKIAQLANSLLAQLGAIFGLHPGFRRARAKGLMLSGTFTPSPEAVSRPTTRGAYFWNQVDQPEHMEPIGKDGCRVPFSRSCTCEP